jgi:hypothetical protein
LQRQKYGSNACAGLGAAHKAVDFTGSSLFIPRGGILVVTIGVLAAREFASSCRKGAMELVSADGFFVCYRFLSATAFCLRRLLLLFQRAAGIRDAPRGAGVAPVRGGTHFLCRRKESKQRKRAHTANP